MCDNCGCGEAPKEEAAPVEGKTCECSPEASKCAEDCVRDLVNLVNVYKEEEKEGVSTKIDPETAAELLKKLEELAVKIGEVCKC